MLGHTKDPEHATPSEHRHLPPGVADGLPEPNPKALAVTHYTALAEQALAYEPMDGEALEPDLHAYAEIDIGAITLASECPLWTFERQLAHYVLSGEITAADMYQALGDYEEWLDAGQPKLTTLDGPWAFK